VLGLRQGLEDQLPALQDLEFREFIKQPLPYELESDERRIAEQIEERVREFIEAHFAEAQLAVDELLQCVTQEVGDEQIIDWSIVTGQELESCIFSLNLVLGDVGFKVEEQYMRAHLSYFVWDDEYWEHYKAPIEGTTPMRTASARKKTKQQRYQYLFQYWFYRLAKQRLEYYKTLKRDCEQAIYRRTSDRNRVYD